jgi:hypothetical protein
MFDKIITWVWVKVDRCSRLSLLILTRHEHDPPTQIGIPTYKVNPY